MSGSPLKALNGFRDFFPEDCQRRDLLFRQWRAVADRFGFSPYDGPPLESLELFTRKSGEEIISQLYEFTDRGERQVALRPEMTPTLARMIGARHRDYKKPIKWYAVSQVFRFERPQKGRLREHYQWNADIIGEAGAGAEIELIALAVEALRTLGLGPGDVVIRISDRQFWHAFLEGRGVDSGRHESVLQALDKMERVPEEETRKKLGDLAGPVLEAVRGNEAALPEGRLTEVLSGLEAMGLGEWVRVDLSIVRGLAYYTGVVFEIHDRKGEFRAVAGGGRYDGLLKHLAGVDLPAVGFGMGDVVLSDLLVSRGLLAEPDRPDGYYVVIADEVARVGALREAVRLREAGYRVDYPLAPTKVGRQFQQAEEMGYGKALVFDGQWIAQGTCGLKDLLKREQEDVKIQWVEGTLHCLPVE